MSPKLGIIEALKYGINRLTTKGGLYLVLAYIFVQIATQVSVQSVSASILAGTVPQEQLTGSYPLAMDLPVAVSGTVTLLMMFAGMALSIVAMRALYSNIESFPAAEHTRRLPMTLLVLIVVSIVTVIAVLVGFIFLFVPGIFLAVCLAFAQVAVAVEDAGVIEALQRSWSLTKGHRLRLFVLGFIVTIPALIAGGVFGFLSIEFPIGGTLVAAVLLSIYSLYGLGVLVGAYSQLVSGTETSTATTESAL